jgi:hypothetical protein
MKKYVILLAALIGLTAAQSFDTHVLGTYSAGSQHTLVMNLDHTFKETIGTDWRNGQWKLRKDSLILQPGMYHSDTPRAPINPAFAIEVLLVKKEGILAGKVLYKKESARPGPGKHK